jgi:hypothetical protein
MLSIIIVSKTTVIANGQVAEVRKKHVSTDNAHSWRDAKKDVVDLDEAIAKMQVKGYRITLTKGHWRGTAANTGFAMRIVRFVKTDLDIKAQQQAEELPSQPDPIIARTRRYCASCASGAI